jgi:hypothetical protein
MRIPIIRREDLKCARGPAETWGILRSARSGMIDLSQFALNVRTLIGRNPH